MVCDVARSHGFSSSGTQGIVKAIEFNTNSVVLKELRYGTVRYRVVPISYRVGRYRLYQPILYSILSI